MFTKFESQEYWILGTLQAICTVFADQNQTTDSGYDLTLKAPRKILDILPFLVIITIFITIIIVIIIIIIIIINK